ncbi:hypothetical protein D3C76_1449070 [compost metagenome]
MRRMLGGEPANNANVDFLLLVFCPEPLSPPLKYFYGRVPILEHQRHEGRSFGIDHSKSYAHPASTIPEVDVDHRSNFHITMVCQLR